MLVRLFRWFSRNVGNLILAFFMAVVVWVAAIIAVDPNQEGVYPRPVPLELVGQDDSMLQLETIPSNVRITLNAPQSIWTQLTEDPELIRAWIDLSGLGKGEHVVQVKTQIQISPAEVRSVDPAEVTVLLEPSKTSEFEVSLSVTGDPSLGYSLGVPSVDPPQVSVSGPESLVDQVVQIAATLDVNGANTNISRDAQVQALDDTGSVVRGIELTPQAVRASQPVNLLGGYRNVVVKVETTGEPADGYWLTNISVSPPNVTVFSTDPQLVNELPGFVETNLIDLTGLRDDVDIRASLGLPEGITLVGEESVLVRLSIAAQEGTLPISLPIEAIGLPPDMEASFIPETVDLLLAGPLPILNNLKPAEVRVVASLNGMEPGVYQVTPVVDLLPSQVRVIFIEPQTVAVTIIRPPTPTPTPTGGTPTPSSTGDAPTPTSPGVPPTPEATVTPSPTP
jgi:YbbR domain-containing protein